VVSGIEQEAWLLYRTNSKKHFSYTSERNLMAVPIQGEGNKQIVFSPQEGKQELAMSLDVDILIYGGAKGAGKSHLLRLKPLLFKDDPYFNGIIFRRTTKQLEGKGGIWEETKELWRPLIESPEYKGLVREQKHEIKFTNVGFSMIFSHMEHETNKMDHQGKEYTMIGYDELTHFEKSQFIFLLDSMRSNSEQSSFVIATWFARC